MAVLLKVFNQMTIKVSMPKKILFLFRTSGIGRLAIELV